MAYCKGLQRIGRLVGGGMLLLAAACQPALPPAPGPETFPPPTAAAGLPRPLAETRQLAISPLPTPTPPELPTPLPSPTPTLPEPSPTAAQAIAAITYTYRVLNRFPHDPRAFTQGLVYLDGVFYESTGLRGQSTVRIVDPPTGQVLQQVALPEPYFGEGIAVLGDRLYQLTWQEGTGFVYDRHTLAPLGTWSYPGEGWGLTTDGNRLIMSDGSHQLRILDPATLQEIERLAVVDAFGQPVVRLNELEHIEGEVWANVWQTDLIARVDLATGRVAGWVDLSGLLPPEERTQPVDVLNGIAYDAATGRLFVTGKWWPWVYEIEVVPLSGH
ncbi:MAG: glutaminyl-peptide cyclotransferase [Caldilineales bacterium]|nr:glutaminyl-peptide cyclotransferase [Caldilineales bacterium]MDW8317582.1 glutaminyl-peptide cyclotransferase [Anaerolineae bacterium]